MSHGDTERTEDYKEKQWKSRRHRRCIERRSLFANSISILYTKRLHQNRYQESVRYTSVALCAVGTSVTLRLPPSPPWLRCLLYKTLSWALHISEEPQFIPMSFVFVNFFCVVQNQYMLFWLLKDALLGCKRCSLRLLLTPFWSLIKHLLLYYLTMPKFTSHFSGYCY